MKRAIDIYREFRKNRMIKAIKPYCVLSEKSFYLQGFNVTLTEPIKNRKYLHVGDDCIIQGSFIFESSEGGISVGERCYIGGSQFISRNSITIGNDVTIAWDCILYDHNSHSLDWEERKKDLHQEYENIKEGKDMIYDKNWDVVKSAPIVIGDKVWIGVGCKILKGVKIGEGAIVGAGSVVVSDVEPYTVVGGNPATVVKCL